MNLTLVGLIVGAVSGALFAGRRLRAKPGEEPPIDGGAGPGVFPGEEYHVRVTASGDSLQFTTPDGKDASRLFVSPSTPEATNVISWEFDVPDQQVIAAQVFFEGGTPLFRTVNAERGRITDDTIGTGRQIVRKTLKQAGVSDPVLGLTEILPGDEYKYSVVVLARAGGSSRAYAADPIVIVRHDSR